MARPSRLLAQNLHYVSQRGVDGLRILSQLLGHGPRSRQKGVNVLVEFSNPFGTSRHLRLQAIPAGARYHETSQYIATPRT
jgi:hypothetical protein